MEPPGRYRKQGAFVASVRMGEISGAPDVLKDGQNPKIPADFFMRHNHLRQFSRFRGLGKNSLDAIADRLNNRPRAIHGFYPPIAVYQAMLQKLTQASSSLQ